MEFHGEMNKEQNPEVSLGWKVIRGVPVAVISKEVWCRGLPVKKSCQTYEVFLIDFGDFVQVNLEDMRPLPEKFMKAPPFAYQVD